MDFIGLDLDRAADAVSISKREIQYAIANNALVARYVGTKPLISPSELQRWFESLPTEPKRRSA